ncbi:MAG: flagellar hook-associated protein FlgK [Planctomycetes bacterium]|nr:flagellar hook-associated protein FlgK [Planctomycetota bacterium]MBI3833890.1 flagellar hook-associated protein FlgK [Planctomycetota bacterium]
MGLLNSALQVGRSALLGYQAALQTIGSNISSAGSPDYTRLDPQMDPITGNLSTSDPAPGAGVALTDIQRDIDEGLEGRLRLAIGGNEAANSQQTALSQIETFFDETSGNGISSRLTSFWNQFEELQNTPEDLGIRDLTISNGVQLAQTLHGVRSQLAALGKDLDSQIKDIVKQADDLAKQIADLNSQITTQEAGHHGQATGLRDQRDAMLRKLSKLFDVTVREQANGSMNVYIGSETLIQDGISRGLTTASRSDGEFVRTSVQFADTRQDVAVGGGQLGGLVQARDQDAYGRIASVDKLAAAVIAEVNAAHSNGQGIAGFKSVTGDFAVLSSTAALNSSAAGLANPPKGGSFYVTVMDDATHTPVAHRVDVSFGGTADTTLQSLADAINTNVTNVKASITSDNKLSLVADDGFSFTFGTDGQDARPDTSGVLAALGINTFFTGTNASNIDVAPELQAHHELLAAATTFVSGDGTNAASISNLSQTVSTRLGGSIDAYAASMANDVAVSAAAANANADASSTVLNSLQAQKESISGVNLDEEAISLLKFQRSYQGAARYVTAVQDSLTELMGIIR